MAIKKIVSGKPAVKSVAKAAAVKAPKAPKAPRVKGKAFVFYAKGEAAAMIAKEQAKCGKGEFSARILKDAFGIEFSKE